MELEFYQRIKRLTIIALFSDDELMNIFVLKGGNALDIIYKIASRSSIDIDISIANKFENPERIAKKMEATLISTFNENGYSVFDFKFVERPHSITPDMADFWGGYRAEFKIIEKEKFNRFRKDAEDLRRNAAPINLKQQKTFYIDISKFEYCDSKLNKNLDDYMIYVYSPEMIIFEKLRAICQQMPEYLKIVKSTGTATARARDFYDIYKAIEFFKIDVASEENLQLADAIFSAKKTPLYLIGEINKYRESHRGDFHLVQNTVYPSEELRDFDFYFDYVVGKCGLLKSLWIK